MPARFAPKPLPAALAAGLLLLVTALQADEADHLTITVPADLLAARELLSQLSITPQFMPDQTFALPEDVQAQVQERLRGLQIVDADDYAKTTGTQDYEIVRKQGSSYQRRKGVLAQRDIWSGQYAEFIHGISALPDQIEVKNAAGDAIPAWWLSLDALDAVIHPNDQGYLDSTGIALPAKLEQCLARWDELGPAQQQYLAAVARRQDYRQIFYRSLLHHAHTRLLGAQKTFADMERDLGLKPHQVGSVGDGLVILGLMQEGEAPLKYSVLTSQFPHGRWIDEGRTVAGIRPLSADIAASRAKADYLQTRWDLKVGPKINPATADLSRIEPYLELYGLGFVVRQMPRPATIETFFAEYRRACVALQEIADIAAAQLGPLPDEAAHERLLDNPYLEAALSEETITLLSAAETFRQGVLARTEKKSEP